MQHRINGRGGQIPVQTATSELPEWLQSALYRGAAKGGLTESDPLWGCLLATAELLKADAELLKSYLAAQTHGTKKSLEELTQAIHELSQSMEHRVEPRSVEYRVEAEHPVEPKSRPKNIAKWLVVILIAAGAVFGAGYFACWSNTHSKLDRLINAAETEGQVPAFLMGYSGSISLGRITSSDGTHVTQGIIISPGDLKFGEPSFSIAGNVLVPITYRPTY